MRVLCHYVEFPYENLQIRIPKLEIAYNFCLVGKTCPKLLFRYLFSFLRNCRRTEISDPDVSQRQIQLGSKES